MHRKRRSKKKTFPAPSRKRKLSNQLAWPTSHYIHFMTTVILLYYLPRALRTRRTHCHYPRTEIISNSFIFCSYYGVTKRDVAASGVSEASQLRATADSPL